jgi:hypothetical protein
LRTWRRVTVYSWFYNEEKDGIGLKSKSKLHTVLYVRCENIIARSLGHKWGRGKIDCLGGKISGGHCNGWSSCSWYCPVPAMVRPQQ